MWLAVDAIKKFRYTPKPRQLLTGWQPPSLGDFKWNVDGSSLGKPGLGGAGGVFRDHAGVVRCIFSIPYGIVDSNLAEVIAIRKALEILSLNNEFHDARVIVESDSTNVVKWVNQSPDDWPWTMHNELCLIKNFKGNLSFYLFCSYVKGK